MKLRKKRKNREMFRTKIIKKILPILLMSLLIINIISIMGFSINPIEADDVSIVYAAQLNGYGNVLRLHMDGSWTIQDGKAYQSQDIGHTQALIADNQYLTLTDYAIETQFDAPDAPTSGHIEVKIVFRWTGNRDMYIFSVENNYVRFQKYVGGSWHNVQLAKSNVMVEGVHQIRVECEGTNIRGFLDGNLLVNVDDSSHTQGKFGIGTFGTGASFEYVNVEAASTNPEPPDQASTGTLIVDTTPVKLSLIHI